VGAQGVVMRKPPESKYESQPAQLTGSIVVTRIESLMIVEVWVNIVDGMIVYGYSGLMFDIMSRYCFTYEPLNWPTPAVTSYMKPVE
jgi:hypothetical protein